MSTTVTCVGELNVIAGDDYVCIECQYAPWLSKLKFDDVPTNQHNTPFAICC